MAEERMRGAARSRRAAPFGIGAEVVRVVVDESRRREGWTLASGSARRASREDMRGTGWRQERGVGDGKHRERAEGLEEWGRREGVRPKARGDEAEIRPISDGTVPGRFSSAVPVRTKRLAAEVVAMDVTPLP